jgi:hypothetical protein
MNEPMSKEDKRALMDSEVYQELEAAELVRHSQLQSLVKTAQTLADKIVTSPTAQQAIRDGIAKALENKDDDGEMEAVHDAIKAGIKKLSDHELFEMCKLFDGEVSARGLDTEKYEEEFEDEEAEETMEDEKKEEKDMEDIFAFVKSSLTKLAYSAADKGNTEAAYLIERCLQKIS